MSASISASNKSRPKKAGVTKSAKAATPALVPAATVQEPGYLVSSPCGRQWFVSFAAVGKDYADFLMQADKLTREEAVAKSEQNSDFWPTWFAEQVSAWEDIEFLGKVVTKSTLFKTKAALDRRRGRYSGDYEEIGFAPAA